MHPLIHDWNNTDEPKPRVVMLDDETLRAARTVIADIRPIVEISQRVGIPIEACTFIGSSPLRQYAEGWTIDQLLRLTEEAISFAVGEGLPVMYVTEDTTRADPETPRRLYSAAIRAGAQRGCVSDTVG